MERRFKDSGHSWIGSIPEHWEMHYLRGVSNSFRKGNGITKEDLNSEGDIACVRYGDLYTKYDHYLTTVECRTNVSKIQNPVYASYGDIYFTCSGEDVEAIGKSIAFLSEEPCLVGGDLIIMKHSQDPKFLGYSLDSYVSQKQKSLGKSKLKVVHISVKDLKNIAVPLPPLAEQEAIAAYLDKKCGEIDELIEVEQQMISDLESYRQSVITEAVTHGLNPDAELKDSGVYWIGKIPERWIIAKMKFFVDISNGSDPKTEGDIPVFGSGATSFKTCGEFKEGPTVLIGRKGATLHIPHYIEGNYWNVDTAFDTKVKNYRLKYFFYIASILDYKAYISATTLPSMTQSNYENMQIPVPPLSEQQEIADYLDAKCAEIDELIKVKREKIETLKQYRQSLIFEAVTGKTSITIDV